MYFARAEREIKIIEYSASKERDGKLRHGWVMFASPFYEESNIILIVLFNIPSDELFSAI